MRRARARARRRGGAKARVGSISIFLKVAAQVSSKFSGGAALATHSQRDKYLVYEQNSAALRFLFFRMNFFGGGRKKIWL